MLYYRAHDVSFLKMKPSTTRKPARRFLRAAAIVGLLALCALCISTVVFLFRGQAFVPHFEHEPNNGFPSADVVAASSGAQGWFGRLDGQNDDQLDVLHIPGDMDGPFRITLAIPSDRRSSLRRPRLAIVGTGLSPDAEGLPFRMPDETGALIMEPFDERTNLSVPFSFKPWIAVGTLTFEPLSGGSYDLAVYDAFGEFGDYLVLFGGDEPSSPADVLRFTLNGLKAVTR